MPVSDTRVFSSVSLYRKGCKLLGTKNWSNQYPEAAFIVADGMWEAVSLQNSEAGKVMDDPG